MATTGHLRTTRLTHAVLAVLKDVGKYSMEDRTLVGEVNITFAPPASLDEVQAAVRLLHEKGMVDYKVDAIDQSIRRWTITAAGLAQLSPR